MYEHRKQPLASRKVFARRVGCANLPSLLASLSSCGREMTTAVNCHCEDALVE
jgi:hypothetical protein